MYFDQTAYYRFVSRGVVKETYTPTFGSSYSYKAWKRTIESSLAEVRNNERIDNPLAHYIFLEVPLAVLLTSKYKTWRNFAKERL